MGACSMATVTTLLGDTVLLWTFLAVLLLLAAYAELRDRGWRNMPTNAHATVVRGETSWNVLVFGFGIIAVNVLQIINSADDSVKFKVLMSTINLVVLIRLFFFNGWFRNKAIGFVAKAQGLEEGARSFPKPPVTPEETTAAG